MPSQSGCMLELLSRINGLKTSTDQSKEKNTRLRLRRFYRVILTVAALIAPAAWAQTQSFSFGNGLGSVTYTVSSDTEFCVGDNGFQAQFTSWSFKGFYDEPGHNPIDHWIYDICPGSGPRTRRLPCYLGWPYDYFQWERLHDRDHTSRRVCERHDYRSWIYQSQVRGGRRDLRASGIEEFCRLHEYKLNQQHDDRNPYLP